MDRLIDAADEFDVRIFPHREARGNPLRGKLKVYLGYAAGVGKTYRMLDEAQALRQKGVDVVIGYFEPHGRKETIAKTEGLEIIPRRKLAYAGTQFEEMDTEAILAPQTGRGGGGRIRAHQRARQRAAETLAGCGRAARMPASTC